MPKSTVRIPKRSISALAHALNATELTQDWQIETIGETIIARKDKAIIIVSFQ